MHVVIVDEELPYPLNSGKRIRTFELISRLASKHRISYLCHRNADQEEARDAERVFRHYGIEPIVVDRAVPPKSGPTFYARLAVNLFSLLPYSVASHTSRALIEAARRLQSCDQVDLWQAEWTPYAQTLQAIKAGPRVIMAHNVESQIWRRYYEAESNLARKWYIGEQCRKFHQFEYYAYQHASWVLAVSREDARRIREELGGKQVEVVDNGVDIEAYRRPVDHRRIEGQLLFVGSLDWRPNVDAVEQLLSVIWPVLREKRSDARLCIVGRNPSKELQRRIREMPGVELHADVADVRPYYWSSSVLVVPLRIGGGSRLKILEAFAAGLPVVSTRVGAEGLEVKEGDLTLVENNDQIALATLRLLEDTPRRSDQTARALRLVESRYEWSRLADRLDEIWQEAAGHHPQAVASRPILNEMTA
jgi:glycosyltransferase involved in cell wall biosynthesis